MSKRPESAAVVEADPGCCRPDGPNPAPGPADDPNPDAGCGPADDSNLGAGCGSADDSNAGARCGAADPHPDAGCGSADDSNPDAGCGSADDSNAGAGCGAADPHPDAGCGPTADPNPAAAGCGTDTARAATRRSEAAANGFLAKKRRASVCSTCPPVAPHSASRARSSRAAAGSRSTKVTCPAPRESDSSPRAPLPAKRSRQRAPGSRGASQLNSVSRTRSGVGRISGDGGKRNFLPRHMPPMILSTRASRAGRM
jgi:hypothetical protein